MHTAPTTLLATAATASPVSMETDATVYLKVETQRCVFVCFRGNLFSVLKFKWIYPCLPPAGAPQRVSGKVSGTVNVGSTPVELNSIDLHAYIVVGDGRAYTAISEVGLFTSKRFSCSCRFLKCAFCPGP